MRPLEPERSYRPKSAYVSLPVLIAANNDGCRETLGTCEEKKEREAFRDFPTFDWG
jgi:hypothetical protein